MDNQWEQMDHSSVQVGKAVVDMVVEGRPPAALVGSVPAAVVGRLPFPECRQKRVPALGLGRQSRVGHWLDQM